MTHVPATPQVGFVSLGCPKARVDSERILAQLRVDGYAIVPSYAEADVVVVNTCGFIGTVADVLVDTVAGDVAVARGPGDAPEIDGVVRVTGAAGARAYDLAAEALAAPER